MIVSDLSIAMAHITFFLGRICMRWEYLWLGLCIHQRILRSGLLPMLAKKHLHFQSDAAPVDHWTLLLPYMFYLHAAMEKRAGLEEKSAGVFQIYFSGRAKVLL